MPGDICAIAKIDEIQFDHILHDSASDAHVHARPLELPTSVFGLAVQPKKRGDEQKVSDVLHKIIAEDPCFRIEHNAQANETVMRGLGEMHLKTVLEKMASQYKLELDTRPPSIAVPRDHRRARRRPQPPQEADRRRRPVRRGVPQGRAAAARQGLRVRRQREGRLDPQPVHPGGGERRARRAADRASSPATRCRTCGSPCTTASTTPVDSKEVAFVSAGRKAFLDALAKARPIVLEPIVNVEITAPEARMGDVAGELSGHRGHIKGSDAPRPGTVQISAQAPLSELEHFPARLKSLTAGHGSYSLEFSHYEPAPPQLTQKLVAAHKPAAHAED